MKTAWYDRSNAAANGSSVFRPDLVVTDLATASPHVLELAGNGIPSSQGPAPERGHQ
jgi:hypothetical protein